MGDFSSPKRREVFDRLRRRYEFYRRHQNGSLRRFENTINGLYEQQRQETVHLQQRWLDSRTKKSSKQSKANKDTSSGHGGDSRNLSIVTQRLKKKIDHNQAENPTVDTSAFDFDDSDTSSTKKSVSNPPGVDVSINIVQQIRGVNSQQEPKIQTNVNVSTTVKTRYSSTPEPPQTSTNVETSTRFECKQEPGIDDTNQSENSQNSSDIFNQDELEDILKSIGDGGDGISEELYEELKRFDQIYSKVLQEDSNDSQDKMFTTGMTSTSPGLQKHAPSASFPDHSPDNMNNVYDGNQNINPIRTPPMHPYRSPPNPAGVTMSETGPAAETLKQMAAQHQSQQHDISYGMKSMDAYVHTPDVQGAQYRQANNGYPNSYDHQQHYMSQNAYLGQQSQNMNNMRNAQVQYGQNKSPEMGLNYGATKPLTHYPTPQQPTPSSLQQLQNQVQAHFNQGPQMEITQTQHMQVSDGPHRSMQMSQTQQLQMRQPHPQIAMSQQQSFSMGPSSQYIDEQMKMEMMEKMRRETLRKQQAQQQQQAADAQSRAAHMQQYMNRPPPEYKRQQSGQTAQEGYSSNGVGTNPLQPMQNMVNQTNTLQTSGYGQIKTESGTTQMQNGMMQSAQMSSMQRMNSSGSAQTAGLARQASASQASTTTYPGQAIQRQQSYPGAQPSAQEARQPRPSGPNFTSAIMRNQRPPNVNVGPEGLNISQPRTQHDWPRQMGPRHGVPAGMNQPPMSAAGMMQYSTYNQVGNMNAVQAGMQMRQTRPMQMSAMQSQAAMMQGTPQAQQMMMQQNMQMSQRMNIRGPMPGNASGSMAPSMDASGSGYASPPVAPHQDDFMNLLDSAPGSGSDFIEGISVQSSDPNNDANWLDEILGGK